MNTADVLQHFNQAFFTHEPSQRVDLIAPDRRVERIQPTAEGFVVEGRDHAKEKV